MSTAAIVGQELASAVTPPMTLPPFVAPLSASEQNVRDVSILSVNCLKPPAPVVVVAATVVVVAATVVVVAATVVVSAAALVVVAATVVVAAAALVVVAAGLVVVTTGALVVVGAGSVVVVDFVVSAPTQVNAVTSACSTTPPIRRLIQRQVRTLKRPLFELVYLCEFH